ncbi:MAG: hypothetical protein RL160_1785 [Bacteroidota bacterium]|jgi:hypothetical protein
MKTFLLPLQPRSEAETKEAQVSVNPIAESTKSMTKQNGKKILKKS